MNRNITKLWAKSSLASISPQPETATNGTSTPLLTIQSAANGESQSPMKGDRQANGEPKSKRRKGERETKKDIDRSPPREISLVDLGGVDAVIEELNEL